MKKIYIEPKMSIYKMQLVQMLNASKVIVDNPDVILGAPEMLDFDNSDELLNFDWQNGLPMF